MKFSILVSSVVLAFSVLQSVAAYPGMGKVMAELSRRQDNNDDGDANPVMIGDLATTGPTTPVGTSIYNILMRTESAQSSAGGYLPPLLGTKACQKDTCCVWSYVSLELTTLFLGPTLRCNKLARAAIRLGFHDAGSWSTSSANGGADGSIALSGTEINRPENNGLQDVIGRMIKLQKKYGVGMADLIQFAATHAVVTCPLGPRIRTFVGRKDSSAAAPDGLLPSVSSDAGTLIKLFQDKTIQPHELAALVGAHSTSKQFFVDPSRAGAPQDGTPGIWDTRFYNQTTGTAPQKVLRFQSDVALAADPRVSDEWRQFAAPGGQSHWNEDYATAYTRLSLLGVNNINSLVECTKVLPIARPEFDGKNVLFVDE